MGLFDSIEEARLQRMANLSGLSAPSAAAENRQERHPAAATRIPAGSDPGPKHQAPGQPQRFSFLPPCPVCGSNAYTYGNNGGFFCSSCSPDIQGQAVTATGKTRPTAFDDDLLPAATDEENNSKQDTASHGANRENFNAAWPWLHAHLPELLVAGWTRAELFQRGRMQYPLGSWGIAWGNVWRKTGLTVCIGRGGCVIFLFISCNKKICQSSWPTITTK